jgi:hypothetical protein
MYRRKTTGQAILRAGWLSYPDIIKPSRYE